MSSETIYRGVVTKPTIPAGPLGWQFGSGRSSPLTPRVLDVACPGARGSVRSGHEIAPPGDAALLFDKLWDQVKGAERTGTLTVEEALDCATRLPQALFCSMMECLAENGEDPAVIVVQVARLHDVTIRRLRDVARTLRERRSQGVH